MKSSSTTPDNLLNSSIFPPLESPLRNSSNRGNYSRGPVSNDRHCIIKLQEQIKQYQDEIKSKDKVIEEMRRIDVSMCPDNLGSSNRIHFNVNDKREIDNLNAKIMSLQMEIAEHNKTKSQQEILIESLRNSNSGLKEDISQLNESLEMANKEMEQLSCTKESFENLRSRNDVVITNLQSELKLKKDQLLELNIEKNELQSQFNELSEQNLEVTGELKMLQQSLIGESPNSSRSIQDIVDEVKSIQYEKKALVMKIEEFEAQLKSRDCEQQASRQTINRLVTKLETHETKNADTDALIANLKKEKAELEESVKIQLEEVESSNCKLLSLQEEVASMKANNEVKEARISELQTSIKNKSASPTGPEKLLQRLIESLIPLLEESFSRTTQDNNAVEWIIDCVYNLTKNKHSSQLALESMNSDCEIITQPDDHHHQQHPGSIADTNHGPHQTFDQLQVLCDDLKTRLDKTSRELMHANVVIDGLSCDKTKNLRVLMELSRIMKIDEINNDLGLDMITEALYGRAKQLQQSEVHSTTQKRLAEHGLTRRVKELEERVRNKQLHIDVLQKKITTTTTTTNSRQQQNHSEKERDRELASNKRLASQNHHLTNQIEMLREEVVCLKGRLLEQEQMRVINTSLDADVKSLTEKLEKLESVRQKQCKKLAEYKARQSDEKGQAESMKNEAQSRVMELTSQLQTVKDALELSQRKERQMSDLRGVVSKLLGLEIDSLAIPDYEIVNRLERLVTAHQSNVHTSYTMDSTLQDLNRALFHDPCEVYSNCDNRQFIEPTYPKHQFHHHHNHHKSLNDVSNHITPKCWAE